MKKTSTKISYEKKITTITHSHDLQIKEIQRSLMQAQKTIKKQVRDINYLGKKLAKPSHKSVQKIIALSPRERQRLEKMERSILDLNAKLAQLSHELNAKSMGSSGATEIPKQAIQDLKMDKKPQENLNTEMLEAKIAKLEERLEKALLDQETNTPFLEGLMLDPRIKYGAFGAGFLLALSLLLGFVALGRSKYALSKTARLSEIVSRSRN